MRQSRADIGAMYVEMNSPRTSDLSLFLLLVLIMHAWSTEHCFYVLQGVSKELSRVKIANFKEENVSFLDNLYLSSLTIDCFAYDYSMHTVKS